MSVISDLKSISDILRKADKIPEYQMILDIQQKMIDLQETNIELKTENKNLKEKLAIKKNLIHRDNKYYLILKDKEDGPFCSKCYDADGKLIRLYKYTHRGYATDFCCQNCKNGS